MFSRPDGHSREAGTSLSQRLALAIVGAIVLNGLAAMLIPRPDAVEAPREAIIARVTLARITRTPTPRPSPTPRPAQMIAKAVVPSGTHARVERVKHAGAKRPTPPKVVYATPDAAIPTGGQGAGAQHGSDAGSLAATNGNGSGTGDAGNGNGSALCGAVDFESIGQAQYNPGTGYYERKITATVYYANGSSERIALDWPWRYKSESDDPFSTDTPYVPFQFPPAGQRASEPPPIQYIIAHTRPNGTTLLTDKCPNIPPPPSPAPSSGPP